MQEHSNTGNGNFHPPIGALPEPIDVSLYGLARAFRFGDNPIFNFRVLPPKFANLRKPTKEELAQFRAERAYLDWRQSLLDPYGVKSAPYNKDLALNLFKEAKHKSIRELERINASEDARCPYFVVNQGGQTKEEINQITAFFGEWDDIALEEQYAKVMAFAIPPHIIIKTRSSLHCYWLAVETTTIEQWERVQRTFIVANNSDPAISDLPRVMRLPGFDHTVFDFETGQLSRVPVTCLNFDTGERLTADQMFEMLANAGQAEVSKAEFEAYKRLRNAKNKQRAKIRQERERNGAAVARLYADEAPPDLRRVFDDICAQLSVVGTSGSGQRAICPCCEDPSPSFIIELIADKILMMCHAGCTFAELCDVVGVEQKHCFRQEKGKRREANAAIEDDEPEDPSIPRGFIVEPDGSIRSFTDTDDKPLFVCSPLRILAHTRADDATSWGKLLEWTDYDQIQHRWAMPMDELKGDSKEWLGRLLNEGLRVGSSRKAKERLSDFIQASNPPVRARCVNRPGWHGGAYVDVAGAIGAPDGEEIILQTGADWPRGVESSGTLEDWKSQIGQHCRQNPLLLFAASVAFAAKLLFPLRLENAGFHLRGTSSKGKTTLIQVAASVEGDGAEKGGFIENWRATANGLEAVCERHNDSILPIDELAQCDPRVAAEAAYLIANGQGKGRMNRTVTARRRASWRTVTLSSGEISLAGHVLQAGKRVRAGQEVRLLDMPIGKRQFGVFDSVNGFSSGQAFADHLKVAAGQFYGIPGREFVRKLIADDPDFSQIRIAFSIFLSDDIAKLAPAGSSSEVTRAAAKFGLVAFAGETATAYGLTGWEEGDAKSAAIELFKEWLTARGSSGGADDEAIVSQVRLFIEQHGESRFCRLVRKPDQSDDEANDRANDRIIINRAGYFDGETYFFSREVFKAEVCRGFDHVEAARALERRKCLEINHGLQFKRRDPESGKVVPFYAVSSAIFE